MSGRQTGTEKETEAGESVCFPSSLSEGTDAGDLPRPLTCSECSVEG